jgi:hypothetical protein
MKKEMIKFGARNALKRCFVTYAGDAPERAESIAFFSSLKEAVFLLPDIPAACHEMTEAEAQSFFDKTPIGMKCEVLTISNEDEVGDSDLLRLMYIPEVRIMRILSDSITDAGVVSLLSLKRLEILEVCSKGVTNACLEYIIKMSSLRHLDMRGAPNVSKPAFLEMIKRMPFLTRAVPPDELLNMG